MFSCSTSLAMAHKWYCALIRNNLRAEGRQGEPGDLEELAAEGDPDDGDAPEQAGEQVAEGHGNAEENDPEDIGQGRNGAAAGKAAGSEGKS